MTWNSQEYEDFYKGLTALETSLYPKTCNNCGKVFATSKNFLLETQSVKNSGIKVFEEDDGTVIIEVFRNCICGSTLLSNFGDRRDLSEAGIARRKKFDELLEFLSEKGICYKQARNKLLSFIKGNDEDFESPDDK